ncbi:HAMP domain-containing histidine kinase [Neorhizobium galegae]|uniref:sensor histidine kinase n=1 Tax=Neorhizobium galegae TaxID=399 RepID=UPI0006216989|nr:HAMP domain-containing sensor histidine kinase [Neorhizobium galegae]MCQ1765895.1 HAMP domain-containing histidine kinase [Neorhizobium galegae]MCQ1844809.1 HAMP domain-containing histidine kinase [Neorhizobium galegae]CDZ39562.1 Putative two-component sensor histidine kinase; heavy-metal sensor (Cu/Zn) [Neorhizobium galegae bv. officinalis]
MRGGSFFKSTAVRLAIIYSSLFVVSYLGANVVAYQMVLAYLDDRLDAAVMERYREIEATFRARGVSGAIDMINSHGPAIRGQETIYTLRDRTGGVIAGNAAISGVPSGFSDLAPDDQHDASTSYKLFRGQLGDNDLIVGISEGDTDQLARIVLVSFGWTTAIVFAVGLGGAAVLRYRSRNRIFALSQTAHAIGHGELSKRLPVSPRMDEIDVLSSEVNVALTRLEASVIALKQVTTDIAHDLKTPIGRTFLVLDDALHREDMDEVKGAVGAALQELAAIASTFDALLRIAQIEARSRTAHFRLVDFGDLVRDIYEIYEVTASEEGHELHLKLGDGDCWISCDPDLIRQMLANLLANSMRHTPAGTRTSLELSPHAGGVALSVSDNGPGIPEPERRRVLERFYRLEKSRTTVGSGLGLSLVKAICDLHDARIELSDNSPGLRVRVTFPAPRQGSL